jgi:tetratricopeptide (TPR) repeat protein
MTPKRTPDQGPDEKRGRRAERLGNRMMKGLAPEPEEELRQAEEVLRWSIRKNGPDSSFSLRAMDDLAEQLAKQGRNLEEAVLREQMVAAIRTSLGPEHDSTLNAELKLATCLLTLEQAEDATPLLAHVVASRTNRHGRDDAATLAAMAWSATAARQLGNLAEARSIQEEVLAGFGSIGAGESGQALSAASNLASTLAELEQLDDATRLLRRVLEIRVRTLAPADARTLETFTTLIALLLRADNVQAALELAGWLVERRTLEYGADAAETTQAREFLAAIRATGNSV